MKNLLFISLSCLTFTAYGQTREFANTIKVEDSDSKEVILEKAAHIVPTANQLRSLENEFIAFVHLGPNTFTRMEWGTGKEDPKIFDLKQLDTDQWCEAMKAAGMKNGDTDSEASRWFCSVAEPLYQTRHHVY